MTQRLLDIVLAAIGLVVAFPLMALLWLLGRFDTGAPLFRQERVGRNQRPFILVKFRTMKPDTERDSPRASRQRPGCSSTGCTESSPLPLRDSSSAR